MSHVIDINKFIAGIVYAETCTCKTDINININMNININIYMSG